MFLKLNWLFIKKTIYRAAVISASIQALCTQATFQVPYASYVPPSQFCVGRYILQVWIVLPGAESLRPRPHLKNLRGVSISCRCFVKNSLLCKAKMDVPFFLLCLLFPQERLSVRYQMPSHSLYPTHFATSFWALLLIPKAPQHTLSSISLLEARQHIAKGNKDNRSNMSVCNDLPGIIFTYFLAKSLWKQRH